MKAGRLQLDAHQCLGPEGLCPGIDTPNRDRAGIRPEQTFNRTQSAGLASAIRPQQAKDLAFADVQVDTVDGEGWTVADPQALDLENGRWSHCARRRFRYIVVHTR